MQSKKKKISLFSRLGSAFFPSPHYPRDNKKSSFLQLTSLSSTVREFSGILDNSFLTLSICEWLTWSLLQGRGSTEVTGKRQKWACLRWATRQTVCLDRDSCPAMLQTWHPSVQHYPQTGTPASTPWTTPGTQQLMTGVFTGQVWDICSFLKDAYKNPQGTMKLVYRREVSQL